MTDDLLRNLDRWVDDVEEGAADGLFLAAEHVLGVSNEKVPHEEGTLERSGEVSIDRRALKAAVSYDMPYAVYQHEVMDLQHDDGRTPKYLENALNGERTTVVKIISTSIKRKAGG